MNMEAALGFVLIILLLALYFAPAIVAFERNTANRYSVLVLNFFLGWTLIGWVVALALAAGNASTSRG